MQSAQKHININTICLQGSIFFCTFKYFLAQHSLKQLIFSLLLFYGLFSFAQEDNTTFFYVNPNTTIVGLDNLNQNTKLTELEKEQGKIYISENTIFFSSQDLATITIESNNQTQELSEKKGNNFSKENLVKAKEQVIKALSKTQVTQTPFPFPLPIEQKQTIIVAAGSITIVTPSTFSKTVSKALTIQNCFSLFIQEAISQKQETICYNQNSKPFKVNTKHFNRPPPMLYC